jgi:hypothetical protein
MDGRGQAQSIGKDGGLVETAVAIAIHQPPDPATMLFVVRIVVHLNDEKPPVFIECQRDGIGDQRFGGDEFEAKRFPELKSV